MIKDSGERTKFPSGALRDMHTGKGRMDLLPWLAIMEVSKHCEAGALKYGEHNVDKGIPTHSLLDSAIRHAAKYLAGYVDEPHLVAAAWNLLWAIEMEIVILNAWTLRGGQPMANKDAMLEALEEIENGMCRIKERRSIWQNSLVYALCQAVRLLLMDKIKEGRK